MAVATASLANSSMNVQLKPGVLTAAAHVSHLSISRNGYALVSAEEWVLGLSEPSAVSKGNADG